MSEELDQPQESQEQPQEQPDNQQKTYQSVMPSEESANAVLGIIAIVAGVIGIMFAFIPCVGWIAAIPLGLASVICGAIHWHQASKFRSNIALGLVGFILGMLALIVIPGKWVVLSWIGEDMVQNLPIQQNYNSQSPYSYQTDSVEVDEELEDVVDDIVEDEEEE
jgi:thiol:disulfide interchange protein